MPSKPSGAVRSVPFKKNPRDGQQRVFDKVSEESSRRSLNIHLPTGYGKSFTSAGVYSILKRQNRANRLLVVLPTVTQLRQFEKDGPADMYDAGVDGPSKVVDIGYWGVQGGCGTGHQASKGDAAKQSRSGACCEDDPGKARRGVRENTRRRPALRRCT